MPEQMAEDHIISWSRPGECNPVKQPLPRRYHFSQNKDADERGENRREILDRDGGGEVHVLEGDEKGEEGQGAEGAARNQESVIVAFPIQLAA